MAASFLDADDIKKLEKDSDSDSDSDSSSNSDSDIDFDKVHKHIFEAACGDMYKDIQKEYPILCKPEQTSNSKDEAVDTSKISDGYTKINDTIPTNIPLPEASASASASEASEDHKDLDPETKSKMKQIKLLQNLYNAADPKFCDMDQMFKQTMSAVVDIITPDEAQTMTFAEKQEQRCKEFMRQVNIDLYACKFKKAGISDEIKSNIEYAKKDLEERGYPVSDVVTLATSNDVDGQKQLFKHSINVTLIE